MPVESVVHLSGFPSPLDRAAFIEGFGPVFEHSPWVAEAAWERRPFASLHAVHRAMVEVVRASPREQQLLLLRKGWPEARLRWSEPGRKPPLAALPCSGHAFSQSLKALKNIISH